MKRILIANRAEIASRIIRAAKALNIETVAVYSDADAHLPYVKEATESLFIGPSAPSESYLRADVIIEAAKESGCDAIHPGYGFLSESAEFVRQVEAAGLTFIGPSASAMDALGAKTAAKAVAVAAGVPVTPWFEVTDPASAGKQAEEIGFPVIVKPAAGGGGKGMYRCDSVDEVNERIERAAREAQSAFGDATLLIEKFLVNPRHIEVQILADQHGTVLHLYERECSIQRRNQKLIEEAPCVALSDEEREKLCADGIAIAKEAGYSNAGTCEFLFDPQSREWYFCEMNTRLQVEHCVSEEITGIDIVQWQMRIAQGEKLTMTQADVVKNGHSMEFRIISEDPYANFAPSLGTLEHFSPPEGEGIRNEVGYAEHDGVTPFYDSMMAKLIITGDSRSDVLNRSRKALREFLIVGVRTCIPFLLEMLEDEGFCASDMHIHYAQERLEAGMLNPTRGESAAIAAAFMAWRDDRRVREAWKSQHGQGMSAWSLSGRQGAV